MCSPCLGSALFSALCALSSGALRSLVGFWCLRSGPGRVARRGALPLPGPRGSPPAPPCRWALPPFPPALRAFSVWFAHAPLFFGWAVLRPALFLAGRRVTRRGGWGACPGPVGLRAARRSGPLRGAVAGLPRSCWRRGLGSCFGGLGLLGSVSGGQ